MSRAHYFALVIIFGLTLHGCASKPVAPVDRVRTSVVLLPDENGHVGAVLVSSAQGAQRIDSAYAMTTVGADHATMPAITHTSQAAVQQTYGAVLGAQPSPPATFTLYFELGKTTLTKASRLELPALFAAAHARKPTEISIHGHSDSIGTDEWNYRLSELRAKSVERILRRHDSTLGTVDVKFLGDREPLVPSPDNVPEPRNRRAEILVL